MKILLYYIKLIEEGIALHDNELTRFILEIKYVFFV